MATNKGKATTGEAITPARAGYAHSRAIVPGRAGVVTSAAKRIACTTSDPAGVSMPDAIVRMYALGIELWGVAWSRADFAFEVRAPRPDNARSAVRGTLHVCTHTGAKGSKQACEGSHNERGEVCAYTFVSRGDSVRRWRATGYEVAPVLATAPGTAQAAREHVRAMVAVLAARFDASDLAATPSVAQAVECGIIGASDLTRAPRAPRAGKATPAPVEVAPVE